jgi:hypothetical protein
MCPCPSSRRGGRSAAATGGGRRSNRSTGTSVATVTYSWNPILFGTVPVPSTSVTPISY